jgi:hypothetical protein
MLSGAGPMAMTGGSGSGEGSGAQPGPQGSLLLTTVLIAKLFARREGDSGGHVLRAKACVD